MEGMALGRVGASFVLAGQGDAPRDLASSASGGAAGVAWRSYPKGADTHAIWFARVSGW